MQIHKYPQKVKFNDEETPYECVPTIRKLTEKMVAACLAYEARNTSRTGELLTEYAEDAAIRAAMLRHRSKYGDPLLELHAEICLGYLGKC